MDSIIIHTSKLSKQFQNKYRVIRNVNILFDTQQILLILVNYLDVSELITLMSTNKQIKQDLERKPAIINRILKAHLNYLTYKEEIRLANQSMNIMNPRSAYQILELQWRTPSSYYLMNRMTKNSQKQDNNMKKMIEGYFFVKNRMSDRGKSLVEGQKPSKTKVTNTFNQKIEKPQTSSDSQQISLMKIEQWHKRSLQREIKQSSANVTKYVLTKMNNHKEMLSRVPENQNSIIIKKITFWDRIIDKIHQSVSII